MKPPAAQIPSIGRRAEAVPAPDVPAAPAGTGDDRRARPVWQIALVCLAVGALTLLTPTTPTYDPWAWILWGREITEFDLLTTGGPSWKPLPMFFTIPFALLGDDVAPVLWVWIARAGGLLGLVLAFRLARRLTGPGWAGLVAGTFALAFLLTSFRYVRDAGLGNSEPMLAAFFLWAFERHLDGRRDHALYLGVAASLLRPEVWPFLGLYGLWLFWRDPELRLRLVGFGLLVPALWFLPEYWGSGDLLRASSRANNPNPGSATFAESPGLEVVKRFSSTTITPLKAAVLVGGGYAIFAFLRRRRDALTGTTLALAALGLAWIVLVGAMTEGGYAGNPRYLIVTTTVLCVLGGIGVARVLQGAVWASGRLTPNPRLGFAAAAAVLVVAFVVGFPVVKSKWDSTIEIADTFDYEAGLWEDLGTVIDRAGGPARLRDCGFVTSGPYQTQMIAYELGIHGFEVGWKTTPAPGVAFQTRTSPDGPLVVLPDDERYRGITSNSSWNVLTIPPEDASATSGCPAQSTSSPRAPRTPETPVLSQLGFGG